MLARLWTDERETGPAPHPHLDGCAPCRARYDGLARWIDGIGDTLRDEADAALTPERLAAQQAQIVRRLEAVDRPARVLAFPKAARAVISGHSHVRRWVTVAAAAGLIAGIGLGQVVPEMRHALDARRPGPTAVLDAPLSAARNARAEKARTISALPSDDELLEDAFGRPRVSALSALDDMTPHVRDIVDQNPK